MTRDSTRQPNRLAGELSPYLLQHAFNPVDWQPWSDEAFSEAHERDCPIFLSIGYSACHWCHVMEHESFEDDSIAAFLNEHFVSIKVDREERPDLDQIYMSALLAQNGNGGWPMSVFLTPDAQPFFTGTYFPPRAKWGRAGFLDILKRVHEVWCNQRSQVTEFAGELTQTVIGNSVPLGEDCDLADDLLRDAADVLMRAWDRANGGFGTAPKFPHAMDIRLLLRLWRRFGEDEYLEAATLSLERMADGGIYDHLGGGFHRYATDAKWLVPHFEKMLYDNALLIPAYVEGWQATRFTRFREVAEETLRYVLREMTHADGGFYSTQDADSEGEEGKFFVWRPSELAEVLGPADAQRFASAFDVTESGNWEGKSILNRPRSFADVAREVGCDVETLVHGLDGSRLRLLARRSDRIAPDRDEKILVSWNGLMIAAMAHAGDALREDGYVNAAVKACDFLWQNLRTEDGRLLHSWKDGQARFLGCLDDYACFIFGLVASYEVSGRDDLLGRAGQLADQMLELFLDPESAGFFFTGTDHEKLIARTQDSQDTATPSGNAMAVTCLLHLATITGEQRYSQSAERALQFLAGQMKRAPMASGQALIALDYWLGPAWQIALLAAEDGEQLDRPLRVIHDAFLPNKQVLRHVGSHVSEDRPLLLQGKSVRGAWTMFPCQHGQCDAPCSTEDEVRAWIDAVTH